MSTYDLVIKRRAIRRFKDKPVSAQLLERCINAARLCPSAANLQLLEYIVIDEKRLLAQVFSTLQWASYIRPDGDPPESNRPTAYIVMLKDSRAGIASSAYDVGAAMENMILVALEEGVGCCPLASVDRDKLKGILNIPDEYEIPLVLAFGYPDESPVEEPLTDSVKYWKDEKGTLHVPKKKLETVLHRNGF
jgi:nitroreductase